MTHYDLIRSIYDKVPDTYKCINQAGEHVIQVSNNPETFATLEKLDNTGLHAIAAHFEIAIREQPVS